MPSTLFSLVGNFTRGRSTINHAWEGVTPINKWAMFGSRTYQESGGKSFARCIKCGLKIYTQPIPKGPCPDNNFTLAEENETYFSIPDYMLL